MVVFFRTKYRTFIAVDSLTEIKTNDLNKLKWLFGEAVCMAENEVPGYFIGPRKEMITPWSTNAVEITQNMGIRGIQRIEEFLKTDDPRKKYDLMLQSLYDGLNQDIFSTDRIPEPIYLIDDIAKYNEKEGLALSAEEINYLEGLSRKIGRKLTDSEVFGFSQVNSEHCRHKIFNGSFIIEGIEKPFSLFDLIRRTTNIHPNKVVSAYKDNCAFIAGPVIEQFAPGRQDHPDFFRITEIETIISLKAETHNFPTTVEPFNGASTGTGGEIRDRIAGGKGAIPLAGTAVYMTSYPRPGGPREWEKSMAERKWLYQTPEEILIKASNGASDFGNKFGQPLICGSVLTFEHTENSRKYGFDKVIMLAGGIGYAKKADSEKDIPEPGDAVILLGGDNYRIGMGGGAVSSVATGEYTNAIELNAIQRANPEMQKRVFNAIRAISESDKNTIISIHDHGAGGHLNCLSELLTATGGIIDLSRLPVGDPTLSAKEIIGNESQERIGLIIKESDLEYLQKTSERERAPLYIIGKATGDQRFIFENPVKNEKPIDLEVNDFFGNPPKTILEDRHELFPFHELSYRHEDFTLYLEKVLQLEGVACKDWLTNKVDRSVTGKIAKQQCAGELQLPLNNLGAVALDYRGEIGFATSLGHSPLAGLVDPASGSVLSIAEALTNIVWAPLTDKMKSVSLSANWVWPSRNPGEDARLYDAVQAASDFAVSLGINIPTGKDSLSMTQKYKDETVYSPGTVIISAAAEITDVRKIVEPVAVADPESRLIFIDFSKDTPKLGGSSFAQSMNCIGTVTPTVKDPDYFVRAFNSVQEMIGEGIIVSGHDISAGGMITTLLEMNFANREGGMNIDLSSFTEKDPVKLLFSENPGVIIQIKDLSAAEKILNMHSICFNIIGRPEFTRILEIKTPSSVFRLDIDKYREIWYRSSYLLDLKQSGEKSATERFTNFSRQPVKYNLKDFKGLYADFNINPDREGRNRINAAIIREKGVNGDREMAYALYLAGMDVKDVHMTDLISGRETLDEINMIVFVGGFSNSDVLGSAKGWAGVFMYNNKARLSLENFYKRKDTLSLGVCNGCQLMLELGLINPHHPVKPKMTFNDSHKFESAFLNVEILKNNSVMLRNLEGYRLGIWVAHGEGHFNFPSDKSNYNIPLKYCYPSYPGNPNGSDYSAAALCSDDGRHLAMMPHIERAFMPWQCAVYPRERINDQITPWIEAFVNAREWIKNKINVSGQNKNRDKQYPGATTV